MSAKEVVPMLSQYIENISSQVGSAEMAVYGAILLFAVTFIIFVISVNRKKQHKQPDSVASPDFKKNDLTSVLSSPPLKHLDEKNFKHRLQLGLSKSRNTVWGKFRKLLTGKAIDTEIRDEVEALLYQADISVSMVNTILKEIEKHESVESIYQAMKDLMLGLLKELEVKKDLEIAWSSKNSATKNHSALQIIMIVGVNGVGKTTTVGKLSAGLSRNGNKVVVAAADTFRAAAKEQLQVWCDRAGAELVTGHENNQDPAAVCYQAVAKAIELKADYCLLDTAGRLHNNDQLMEELKKIKRVISKLVPDAPHETLIVLDAMTGQNALKQALQFKVALEGLSGVILTKCDGSAKAGCALSIVEQLRVPIRFIGVGETLEDLDIFKAEEFVDALLAE